MNDQKKNLVKNRPNPKEKKSKNSKTTLKNSSKLKESKTKTK